MNPLVALLGVALFIYGIFYKHLFLILYFLIVGIYIFLTQRNKLDKYNNKTRKMLISAWNGPSNPNVYINYVWEIEKALNYIKKINESIYLEQENII